MSQIETVFRWNDKEYPFDIRDAEDAEKFEKATEDIQDLSQKMKHDGRASEMIRTQCTAIKQFFTTCFDEKQAVEICGEKARLDAHYAPYAAFCEIVASQRRYFTESRNAFMQFSNRQQRRHPGNNQNGKNHQYPKKHNGGKQ